MRSQTFFHFTLFLVLLIVAASLGQDRQTYQHPVLNFQVHAFKDWVQVPHPEDDFIYEIADPESVIRILMWYTETESSGSHYLKEMADMKELIYDAEPIKGKINNRDAWILDATCCMKKSPVRVVLVAIPDEQEDQSLYIAQILCPEDKFEEKEESMEGILYSLQIMD